MTGTAAALAHWAATLVPTDDDLALARRSLTDTVAVTLAAEDHPIRSVATQLTDSGRWAAIGHVLDFDDLHLESTTHISVVVVPTVLATGGDARAYLAGAGVMARLGRMLGWSHYTRGWHATSTSGAPAAAVAAGISLGLDEHQLATAIALAVPGSGGVQRAFGTHGKALQVGFAAEAGVRAATLAAAGATADSSALDQWLELVGGDPSAVDLSGPAVPGGLAIKVFPCCYALQRPIAAVRELRSSVELDADDVASIIVRTPAATLTPLIHDDPRTGLQGKFSLEYAVASALLDDYPGFASFTDEAVNRPAARGLVDRIHVVATPGGDSLLAGEAEVEMVLRSGQVRTTRMAHPPGSPERPPGEAELSAKLAECGPDVRDLVTGVDWAPASRILGERLPGAAPSLAGIG